MCYSTAAGKEMVDWILCLYCLKDLNQPLLFGRRVLPSAEACVQSISDIQLEILTICAGEWKTLRPERIRIL